MENSWKDQLDQELIKQLGRKKGKKFAEKYLPSLSMSYCEQHTVEEAITDLVQIDKLSLDDPLTIVFFESPRGEYPLHIKLYRYGRPIPLSDILPMIENMGLRTYTERPYKISIAPNQFVWISDFNVTYAHSNLLTLDQVKNIFNEALIKISVGICENDGFNKLVLGAGLSWREIVIIRAYAKYMQQIGFRFSQQYIEKTIATYSVIVKKLIQLFYLKFGLKQNTTNKNKKAELEKEIRTDIDAITSLDEDHIIRFFWSLIKATLRTNYFQLGSDGEPKEYLSFKLNSAKVPDLPPGQPMYEIFVYSTRFEGIHLRSAKVARGGLRWSDRPEDFRTEVLGLMKAQKVKNSVIVPSGAKGGFILKKAINMLDREKIKQEVIYCYQSFIRGLLDLTDNLVDDRVVSPKNTVCYDEADPYLVVAADKGTATFSDIANGIAKEYNFWLGDAFASGGSAGYDHKKMGITARGAWESVKRHFRELDVRIEEQDFTVVGIGDMSGDVFGNGLTYTSHALLLAAFDHRHIFLDPNPNGPKTFAERQRLFNLPTSSWEDFNPRLISKGGGVYSRLSKSIAITPEVKKALSITANSLTPNELIREILKAPVDLLFNGGIGTYVKASTQSHADVGDKTNEFCRVDGNELRCKIVGEGGNLGVTQLGRVEFALQGGLINTDSIDNSAGVNCSDHEVNIKILLNKEMIQGKLTEKKRNQLLTKMTEQVAELVLQDNYNQALVLSFSATNALAYSGLYQAYIKELETVVHLDRSVEFLPDEKHLLDRKAAGQALTRPELSIIMAYTKIYITGELLKSDLPDDPYFATILETGFPSMLIKSYAKAMQTHRLRREIIATQLSNQIVNSMGITFMYRLHVETGQTIADIARAYIIAAKAYRIDDLNRLIDSLNYKVTVHTQYELLHHVRQLMNLATRWFLHHKRLAGGITNNIAHYSQSIAKLEKSIPDLMAGVTKEYLNQIVIQFVDIGLPEEAAKKIAATRAMYTVLNVIEVATQNKFDLGKTAEVYFKVGSKFSLVWFRDQIGSDSREGHWNSLARLSLRDELDNLQRRLTIVILMNNQKTLNSDELIAYWLAKNPFIHQRWEKLLEMLLGSASIDYTIFFIALRELSTLITVE
ncbi:NAD-glutamate dehydrogenase domain-containing protein [Legionella anisa]|uniref:NAD-glutamate dehydrogenase n=1 Tax=Legionella anisa TaxID=28082 RepID=A0AAX0WUZ8_9GAMM|nr:NAD-glutamate dehydrogenase domain-containing protein [Legionella anisa]AWN73658.1 NAD-glutamate dehydrogenase [Legionella anisa]KTC75774.1 NAD-glutamate dehydrogenase [Legionella anisa]MBN5935588.1 NAD-glutamate dehydrogenase [Legionella anisa]MCW8426551.1 NAD-glutamate dehydrogenase [Legionella anisa]MCW8448214.1 NAD-glutamate dehydrogenase [Legionella anisa]